MTFDPLSPEVRENPYPFYADMRVNDPVSFCPTVNTWAVTRHEDVKHVLKNHQLFSSDPLIQIAFGEFNPAPGAPYLLSSDPPEHSRLRKLVATAFSKKFVDSIAASIEKMINELLDETSPKDGFDLMDALASPLPVTVIADVMGIDASMGPTFRRWSNQVTVGVNQTISTEERAAIQQDAREFRAYFIDRIAAARRNPGSDIISALVRQEEGAVLTPDEVMAMCVLLLIAGNETTTSTLGNAILLLTQHPDQRKLVLQDPSLTPALVEEVLRFISPIQMLFRRATEDVVINGVSLPKDTIVMPVYASANRDEAVFERADQFDVTRGDISQHMAFGHGIHFCVGQALGRHEATVALRILLRRMPQIACDFSSLQWNDSFYLRGPKHLRVAAA
ncbi:cytochrome P450 [Solimonas terrae]|uniref:Cytochrome P450 n=1 Tax=Solimonas terrae TaxID=1396819 RepID=A0A6M2BVW4_9GAMM|nr:cytochrome P450 [Solimonas terrae]NGY06782.1 cytochrome P450 [Solimonas terrae]